MTKWIVSIVLVFLLGGLAYQYRVELMLQGIGLLVDYRNPISPHREVDWGDAELPDNEKRMPNIVLILADDLGFNDITVNGGGVAGGTVPTPNIDSIARDGVLFTNGYAANATCAPSRAALMTGKYPTRFGFEFTPTPNGMLPMIAMMSEPVAGRPQLVTHFDEQQDDVMPYEEMGLPTEEITLAETVKKAGYYTAHIGKWHLGHSHGMSAIDQGFDDSLLMASGLYMNEDDPRVVNSKQDFDPIDRFLWKALRFAASFNNGDWFEPGGYLTDYYTEEALKVIEKNRDRPFFLYLAHWAPHTPLQASKEDYDSLNHIKNHRLRVYAAMIRALDRGVGQVLDALEKHGIADNTLVIFTSDNGGAGYIGLPQVNQPYRGWKMSFFEGGLHVPYFMKWPDRIAAGSVFEAPVHHFDIFASAAAAGGADTSELGLDGVDLIPYSTGEMDDQIPHERLFWRSGHYQTVLAGGWKMQRADRPDKVRLHHLLNDPTEHHNVAEENPDQVAKMLAMLDEHNATQVESRWPAMIEGVIPIDRTSSDAYEEGEEYIYWPN